MRRNVFVALTASVAAFALVPFACLSGCGPGAGVGGGSFNLPPVPVISTDIVRGIAPLTIRFSSENSSDDGLIVARQWEFGDGGTSQDISPTHTFTTTGAFTVTLTLRDDNGATNSRSVTISVTQSPVARIVADKTSASTAPALISFDGSSSSDPDGEIVEYQWDFGDGSREFLPTVVHNFAAAGTYRVRLTVTDDTGVTNTAEQLVSIGIPRPSITFRTPPAGTTNIFTSLGALLWVQAELTVEPGVPRTVRAGLDGDTDPCSARGALYEFSVGSKLFDLAGQEDRVRDIAYSTDGLRVMTASDDGTLYEFRVSDGLLLNIFDATPGVTAVAYSPNGTQFAYGQSNGEVVLRNRSNGAVVRQFLSHAAAVNELRFSTNGLQILTAGNDNRALLWNVADGSILRDFVNPQPVNSAAFSPTDAALVATGGEDGFVRLWNITSGALITSVSGHVGAVNAVAFSPDGTQLASGGDDNTIRIWNPTTFAAVRTLTGHTDDVLSLAFSPDGQRLISGSADHTARIWTASTGEFQRSLQPCASPIAGIAVAPNSQTLALAVAARNDIQLDTTPANGNDLNITAPQGLVVEDVEPGRSYYLWAEVDTDRSDPVRAYNSAVITVTSPFPSTLAGGPPQVISPSDEGWVVTPATETPSTTRQIFDLGPLARGDRLTLNVLRMPGFTRAFESPVDFSLMVIDANEDIFAWYQEDQPSLIGQITDADLGDFVLFTPESKLVIGHNSSNYYVVSDGGNSVYFKIEREFEVFQPRGQRVLIDFNGSNNRGIGAGGQDPVVIPALNAGSINPGVWDDTDTQTMRASVMQTVRQVFAGYDIVFFATGDAVQPEPPYQTIFVGGIGPTDVLGVADYVDPRNDTATGTGIVFAVTVGQKALANQFANPAGTPTTVGQAIGYVAAHAVGQLLGLRHTDDPIDIMKAGDRTLIPFNGALPTTDFDPTIPRQLRRARPAAAEQIVLPPIGFQNVDSSNPNNVLFESVGGL